MKTIFEQVEGNQKGLIVRLETQLAIDAFFGLGIINIQNECNEVAKKYRALWGSKPQTELMKEYYLDIPYSQGLRELEPTYELSAPQTLRIRILDSAMQGRPDTPAMVTFPENDETLPLVTIFLNSVQIKEDTVMCKGNPFSLVVYHELAHACGEISKPGRPIHDGIIRHTLVIAEAIKNLENKDLGVYKALKKN